METTKYADREKQAAPGRKALTAVGAIFFMFYFVLGLFFLFSDKLPFIMSPGIKTFFGILLIAYSGFRLWRIVSGLIKRGKA